MLVHPLIQCVDDGAGSVGIAGEPLFDHAGQRRPQERAIDAHVLHQRQPWLGIEEGIETGHRPHLVPLDGLARGGPEAGGRVLTESAGHRDPAEGGVRDVITDRVPDGELGASVDVDVLDDAVVLTGNELDECFPVLVEVIVGVECLVRQPPLANVDERRFISHLSSPSAWTTRVDHATPRAGPTSWAGCDGRAPTVPPGGTRVRQTVLPRLYGTPPHQGGAQRHPPDPDGTPVD